MEAAEDQTGLATDDVVPFRAERVLEAVLATCSGSGSVIRHAGQEAADVSTSVCGLRTCQPSRLPHDPPQVRAGAVHRTGAKGPQTGPDPALLAGPCGPPPRAQRWVPTAWSGSGRSQRWTGRSATAGPSGAPRTMPRRVRVARRPCAFARHSPLLGRRSLPRPGSARGGGSQAAHGIGDRGVGGSGQERTGGGVRGGQARADSPRGHRPGAGRSGVRAAVVRGRRRSRRGGSRGSCGTRSP